MLFPDPALLADLALFAGLMLLAFADLDTLFSHGDEPAEGPDTFEGTPGDDDLLDAAIGPRLYDMGAGDDTLDAGDGDDTILGGSGDDLLAGRLGDDLVDAGDGDDRVTGGFGRDSLAGGAGDDLLEGEADADSLVGGSGADTLEGGEGDDVLLGGADDDLLWGGSGADLLEGQEGDDTLNGATGEGSLSRTIDPDLADTLNGGEGDDRLILGAGDQGTGGDGADTFAVDEAVAARDPATAGAARITDFDRDADVLVVEYPPGTDDPVLEVVDFADGTGADLVLNGVGVASVTGAQGLDAAAVRLVPVAP